MKLRWWATSVLCVTMVGVAVWQSGVPTTRPSDPEVPAKGATMPLPSNTESALPAVLPNSLVPPPYMTPPSSPVLPSQEAADFAAQPPLMPPWETTVSAGDTLDGLLARAGIDAALRSEFALAIMTEFDLSGLRPGHRVAVQKRADGTALSITLTITDGERVIVTLDDKPEVQRLAPKTTRMERAQSLTVEGSIFAALERADAPTRFALDLAQMMAGIVDFRRDLTGGEGLTLLWTEELSEAGERIGRPVLSYAALTFGEMRLEVVWPKEVGEVTTIFRDGALIRTFAPPVVGAQLTSIFGKRRHPVYGDVRMHTGVDLSAPRGTPVYATAAGRVVFVGRRNGYGRVIEIAHGASLMTRYSHLSAFSDGLAEGDRIQAGRQIGTVGSSGLATAPNLHYEVRLDDKPIDPLDDVRLAGFEPEAVSAKAKGALREARTRLASVLDEDEMPIGSATLSTKENPT